MTDWFDLSQDFYDGMPHSSVYPSPSFETLSEMFDQSTDSN